MAATWVALATQGYVTSALGDYVAEALFNANTILAADTDNVPAALEITEQTVVGRLTGGNIKALSAGELLTLVGAPATGDVILKSIADAKGDLIVASAADTVGRLAVGNAGDHFFVNSDTPGWHRFKPVTVANNAAAVALTSPALGQMVWSTADLCPLVCTDLGA